MVTLVLFFASAAHAAAGDDFYENLYRRGIADFQRGAYEQAIRELRIAAFGLMESPERFEIAEAYVVVAAARRQREADERTALRRIIAAEHIERHYASLDLPPDIRAELDKAATALLLATDVNYLRSASAAIPLPQSAAQPAPPPAPVPVPQPVPQPKIEAPNPQLPPPPAPQPAPQPAPVPVPQPVPQPNIEAPKPQPPSPPPQPEPQPAAKNVGINTSIQEGDRAINAGDLAAARAAFTSALAASDLTHTALVRIGEGLYRARDFRNAVAAFDRAGTFAKGEEPYRYYYAVALYEIGRYGPAKRELAAALPYIRITPDVDRYRQKIEGAIE